MNPNNSQPYGFFGFPSTYDHNKLWDYKEFFVSGTYQIPIQHNFLTIMLVSGGNGGGSGRVSASNVNANGGCGGYGGSVVIKTFLIKDLIKYGYILDIEIGSGGDGGQGQSSPDSDGNDGIKGGSSRIKFSGSPMYFMNARSYPIGENNNGKGGASTTQTVSTSISLSGYGIFEGKAFTQMSVRGSPEYINVSAAASDWLDKRPCCGMGGGSKNTVPTYFNGLTNMNSTGLASRYYTGSWKYVHFGFSGITNSGTGQAITTLPRRSIIHPNWFPNALSGAASSTTPTAGGNGKIGVGGSGGGATINGVTSGAGGKGGDGFCLIVSRG
jgi:hypothetical protein